MPVLVALPLLVAASPIPQAVVSEAARDAPVELLHSIAIDAEGRTLFLGTHFGLFRSDDGGNLWRRVRLAQNRPHPDVLAIAPDPRDSGTVYIGTHEVGVFKSSDHGATWRLANAGLGGLDVHGLAVRPDDRQRVYALVLGTDEGLYVTSDAGGRWTHVAGGPPGELRGLFAATLPTSKDRVSLYAATSDGLHRRAEGPIRGVGSTVFPRTAASARSR